MASSSGISSSSAGNSGERARISGEPIASAAPSDAWEWAVSRNLLIVIVDLNPVWWGLHRNSLSLSLIRCLESVLAFCNAHLIMSQQNEVALIGVTSERSEFLYPVPFEERETTDQTEWESGDGRRPSGWDGKYECLTVMNEQVKRRAQAIVAASSSHRTDISVSGAITKGLCLYHRRARECNLATGRLTARLLVVKAAEDNPSQYMALMNAVFTAQKLALSIDACLFADSSSPTPRVSSMNPSSTYVSSSASTAQNNASVLPANSRRGSGLLQQAAALTGGIYLCVPQPSALLQYLFSVFLPGTDLRSSLILPCKVGGEGVDFRAACFCHRKLVDVGFVCSVCLSIFCEFSPICTTCHTQFRLNISPTSPLKRGKK